MVAVAAGVFWLTLQAVVTVVGGIITAATWIGSHLLLIGIAVAAALALLR